MITAEVSYWSVVFYGNGEANSRELLQNIYDGARAKGVGAGSVGVFDEPGEGTLVHVDLMHCDKKKAIQILATAGIPVEQVAFTEVSVEWDEQASRRNRQKRHRV